MMKYIFLPVFFLIETIGFSQNNQTKNSKIREMSTDRPDVTESAFTVPAGYFQLETDLVKFSTEKISGVAFKEINLNAFNLKYGISKTIDLQLVIKSIVTTSTITPFFKERKTGFGDITFRFKKNIFGNDEGKIALAVMPFINIPVGRNESNLNLGIVISLAISLGKNWNVGAQIQTVVGEQVVDRKIVTQNLFSATVGHPVCKNVDIFIETVLTNLQKEWALLGNGGIVYLISPYCKIDAGFNLGLAGSNAQIYFLGLSIRI
ncbi:MAG: transporter [Ginsengibacter sp.]